MRPPLSPIMEQSPFDEKLMESAASRLIPPSAGHGTIVGEGLAAAQLCLTTSSTTMVQAPPPAVLSFREQTTCPADSSHTIVYTSPKPPPKAESSIAPRSELFTVAEDPDRPASPQRIQNPVCDVPMSPEVPVESDTDVLLRPRRPRSVDVPMSPEQQPLCADVPMSPEQPPQFSFPGSGSRSAMNPDRRPGLCPDVSMNVASPARTAAVQLISDPWDDTLISGLLSTLSPPLTSHPCCVTWPCNIPAINPRTTISMGTSDP